MPLIELIRTHLIVSKNKKNKKKKAGKGKPNGQTEKPNGAQMEAEDENGQDDAVGEEQDSMIPRSPRKSEAPHDSIANGILRIQKDTPVNSVEVASEENRDVEEETPHPKDTPIAGLKARNDTMRSSPGNTDARLEALAAEREALREEVAQVRRSLEEIQEKHEEELGTVREQLRETQGEKEQAESQYRSLLGKVNTIKSQLGERLKADAVSAC